MKAKTMYAVEHYYTIDERSTYEIFETLKEAEQFCFDKSNWNDNHFPTFIFKADFNCELIYKEQNGRWNYEDYKHKHQNNTLSQDDFFELQQRFIRFIIGNTAINGSVEIRRIFPKLFNVYACQNNLPGSIKGRMSKHEFYYTDLMYNRKNWRDTSKDKTISRQQQNQLEAQAEDETTYNTYLVQKAITKIKKMYSESEVKDQWSNGEATQVHHIFPKSKFPQIAHYLENLIKLTPTQHYTKAHPNNKTDTINKDYQLVCLLAKSNSIEHSLKKGENVYRKESFIFVINMGLNTELNINLDFQQIKADLVNIYNNL